MFELKTPTDVKLAKFTPRVEKHGKEEVSAATLKLYFHRTPAQLDEIAPGLSDMLLKAVEAPRQGVLPSVEPTAPTLVKRCTAAQAVLLKLTTEGATLKIERGIDESDPMVIGGCKVDAVEIDLIDDDGAMVACNVGSNDLSEDEGGWLYGHQRRMIRVQLLAPEIKPDAIDGSTEAFRADHPDATDLFAAGGPDDDPGHGDDDGSGHTDTDGAPGAGSSDEQMGKDWPFPRDGAEGPAGETEAGPGGTEGPSGETPAQETGTAPRARRGRKTAAQVE